jgi:hypothetical protein
VQRLRRLLGLLSGLNLLRLAGLLIWLLNYLLLSRHRGRCEKQQRAKASQAKAGSKGQMILRILPVVNLSCPSSG